MRLTVNLTPLLCCFVVQPKKRTAGGDKATSAAKKARTAANDGEVADIRGLVAAGTVRENWLHADKMQPG